MDLQAVYKELDDLFQKNQYQEVEGFLKIKIEDAGREKDLASALALWNELGGFLRVSTKYKEGIEAFENALEIVYQSGLEESEQEATIRMNLATLYVAAGVNEKASAEYGKVALIYEKLHIQDYRFAALQNNRASLYLKEKQYDLAEKSAKSALALICKLSDNEDETGVTNTILAQIYMAKCEYEKAWEYILHAEAAFLRLPSQNPMHDAVLLSAKGQILSQLGKWEEARQCYERSLPLIERNFGKNLSYAFCLKNLARCCRELQDMETGDCFQREAEEIEKEQRYEGT